MPEKKLLLFDFDGTVIDNSEGIFNCIRYAADKLGMPRPAESQLRAFVGPPLYASFQKYMGADHETALALVEAYRERYRPLGTKEAVLYPRVKEVLEALRAEGYILAVCSGKPRDFVMAIAERLGIFELFTEYYCTTFQDTKATKADYIRRAMAENCVSPAETVMVGDTESDILAAKETSVMSVGASYGFAAPGELEAAGADAVADTPADVPLRIRELDA
jgi:phosphoglycolate phosphatase